MEDVRRPSAFQAGDVHNWLTRDACHRSYVGQLQPSATAGGSHAPILKPVLASESSLLGAKFTASDPDGWQLVVQKRKRKPPSKKPQSSHGKAGKVPADLVGLYFKCFHDERVSRNYPYPSCCLRCREVRRAMHDCAQLWLLLGDKRQAISGSHRQQSP
jgi:hypothetical protein